MVTYYIKNGEIRKDNDCVLKAIEYSTGISYKNCKKITKENGWTSEGISVINAIASLWDAANKKPIILGKDTIYNLSNEEIIKNRTGILFVDKHCIGVKDGVPNESINSKITCVAWI